MKKLKTTLQKYWLIWMLVVLVLKPRKFMLDFVHAYRDYRRFRHSIQDFRRAVMKSAVLTSKHEKKSLLIVAGQGMNVQWLQIWTVLGALVGSSYGYRVLAITTRNKPIQNLYLRIFQIRLLYLEDLRLDQVVVPQEVVSALNQLVSFRDFKEYEYQGIPVGKMALSTFSRQRTSGVMDISDPDSRAEVRYWLEYLYKSLKVADQVYRTENVSMLFFTEVFMEEYGAFYYAALKNRLNILRFAGTVRDDAIVVQHLTEESDRKHFSSISAKSWERILGHPDTPKMDEELEQNFADRYGDRWVLSKRNQPNTRMMSAHEARTVLNVPEGSKVAVIYSHILYDTLFFNGEDLFENYAEWLIKTVKAACANTNLIWFIKIHPSNLWRGELESILQGKYEEVRLIEQHIGDLPEHVRFAYPTTPISPYTWLQIADIGITVRGTSGIELAALGKTVITAGSGRYENVGFTLNSASREEYLDILSRLPEVSKSTAHQKWLGRRFAYATFCMKPFVIDFMTPQTRSGRKGSYGSDDIIYMLNMAKAIPDSMQRFAKWSCDRNEIDYLNDWPT
jgi:hypothetical protein